METLERENVLEALEKERESFERSQVRCVLKRGYLFIGGHQWIFPKIFEK